eukprot:PhF_6_TR39828/c0_g1_i1/m.59227
MSDQTFLSTVMASEKVPDTSVGVLLPTLPPVLALDVQPEPSPSQGILQPPQASDSKRSSIVGNATPICTPQSPSLRVEVSAVSNGSLTSLPTPGTTTKYSNNPYAYDVIGPEICIPVYQPSSPSRCRSPESATKSPTPIDLSSSGRSPHMMNLNLDFGSSSSLPTMWNPQQTQLGSMQEIPMAHSPNAHTAHTHTPNSTSLYVPHPPPPGTYDCWGQGPLPSSQPFPPYTIQVETRVRTTEYGGYARFAIGDHVIVEGDRGEDLGRIVSVRPTYPVAQHPQFPKILRTATMQEVALYNSLTAVEQERVAYANTLSATHNFGVQVHRIALQYDQKKMTVFYTPTRESMEFKQFVHELYNQFRCRVWMEKMRTPQGAQATKSPPVNSLEFM